VNEAVTVWNLLELALFSPGFKKENCDPNKANTITLAITAIAIAVSINKKIFFWGVISISPH